MKKFIIGLFFCSRIVASELDSILSDYAQATELASCQPIRLLRNRSGRVLPYKAIRAFDVSDCELNSKFYKAARKFLPDKYPKSVGFVARLSPESTLVGTELATRYAEMRLLFQARNKSDPASISELSGCSACNILSAYDTVKLAIYSGWFHGALSRNSFENIDDVRFGLDARIAVARKAEKRMCLFVKEDSLLRYKSRKASLQLECSIMKLLISKLDLSDCAVIESNRFGGLYLWVDESRVLDFGNKIRLQVIKKAARRLAAV